MILGKIMSIDEGKLSRWSRLKQLGGVSEKEEAKQIHNSELKLEIKNDRNDVKGEEVDATRSSSVSSVYRNEKIDRRVAPVMAPLAGLEEGDTEFESPPAEALALLEEEREKKETVVESLDGVEDGERSLSDEEKLVVANLPPLESLTSGSDFRPFMAEKVPSFIRRKALHILWRSNPIFAHLDGLNDYDEDFNIIDKLIDAASDSFYQVGKGIVNEEEEAKKKKNADGIEPSPSEPVESKLAVNSGPTSDESKHNDDSVPKDTEEQLKGSSERENQVSLQEGSNATSIRNVRKPENKS